MSGIDCTDGRRGATLGLEGISVNDKEETDGSE